MKKKKYTLLITINVLLLLFAPVWLVQVLAFLILLTLAFSFLYARAIYTYVHLHRVEQKINIHRDESVTIKFYVENRCFLPVHSMLVKDNFSELNAAARPTFFFSLKPWQKKTCTYQLSGSKRGLYKIGPMTCSYSEPLGFFSWEKKCEQVAEVIVYPRVLSLALIHTHGLPVGDIHSNNIINEDLTRYRSVREYVPGDDIRRINWKISARQGSLFCLETLPTHYFPTLLLLNLTLDDYPLKSRYNLMERAIETAASLIYYIVGLKQQIGFLTSGIAGTDTEPKLIPLKNGYEQAVSLLELLAFLQPSAHAFMPLLFESEFNLPYRSRLLVISPHLTEPELNYLYNASQKGYMVEIFHVAPTKEELKVERELEHPGLYFHYVKDYGTEII